jgi:radical SAM superfamily enzyme YgiQ (UPF0313 family)
VALSTYTARAFDAYLVADAYRAHGVPVVFGGLHATVLPEEVALHADAVVAGEGELTWPEVVRDFQRAGRAGLKKIYREAKPGQFHLDKAPMPRFDLLTKTLAESKSIPLWQRGIKGDFLNGPNATVTKKISPRPSFSKRGNDVLPPDAAPHKIDASSDPDMSGELHRLGPYNRITVQTTRGCPWDCEFCAASKLYGPRYRIKPVERVLQEIDAVRSMWRRPFIEFADDNTFVNRSWSKRLLRELAGRHIRYFTETDVSVADDEELLDLLYPSGCRQVLIGFESPRRASLEGIDRANWKATRLTRYLEAIDKIQSRGVSVCGCFIVGLDSDTPEVFDEVREFVDRSRLLEVQITVQTPFPGTRLYQRLLAEGRLLYPGAWDRCTLFDINFRPKGMSVDQLEEGVMQLWRDTWNAQAFAWRKRHYRELLRARRKPGEEEIQDQIEEYFALPASA